MPSVEPSLLKTLEQCPRAFRRLASLVVCLDDGAFYLEALGRFQEHRMAIIKHGPDGTQLSGGGKLGQYHVDVWILHAIRTKTIVPERELGVPFRLQKFG